MTNQEMIALEAFAAGQEGLSYGKFSQALTAAEQKKLRQKYEEEWRQRRNHENAHRRTGKKAGKSMPGLLGRICVPAAGKEGMQSVSALRIGIRERGIQKASELDAEALQDREAGK